MKNHFKKKFNNQNKSSHALKRDFNKDVNKQQNDHDKSSKFKAKFDGYYNFYGIYGHRENDCDKKMKDEGGKGS